MIPAISKVLIISDDGEAREAIRQMLGREDSRAANRHVTIIERLSSDLSHPVQRAWLALQTPQCGYCQAGQMMTAATLLAKIPHATDADIDDAMSANLCRCGTYHRIGASVHRAAELGCGGQARMTAGSGATTGTGSLC